MMGVRATQRTQYCAGRDSLDRLTQENNNNGTVSYAYNDVGLRANPSTPLRTGMNVTGQNTIFYRYDNASRLTNVTQGASTTSLFYADSGRNQPRTTTGAALTNTSKFTAREDDGTGLYCYRARYYHPALGRFVSEDPLEVWVTDVNQYDYVLNNPVYLTDLAGLAPALNLFCQGDQRKTANQIPDNDDYYIVAGHGCPVAMQDGKGNLLSPMDLAQIIAKDKKFKGQPVLLASCDVGKDPHYPGLASFAEEVSKALAALGKPARFVSGPDCQSTICADGMIKIDPNKGRWRVFRPPQPPCKGCDDKK